MHEEKRKYPRYDVKLDCRFTDKEKTITISSKDISEGGVFLFTTAYAPPVGTPISIVLHLPEDIGDVTVSSTVAHSLRGIGMGIEFNEFQGEGLQRLRRFIELLKASD